MPGIADKFTQSAQGRLLRPGMTATLNALLRGGFEVHGSFRERGQSLIRLPLLLQGLIQQANRILDAELKRPLLQRAVSRDLPEWAAFAIFGSALRSCFSACRMSRN